MILENQDEINAFKFVCKLAGEATDRICNDLEEEDHNKFKHLFVKTFDMGLEREVDVNIGMDFEVIHWLNSQIEEDEE